MRNKPFRSFGNEGYTLVELIVSILIMSVLSGMIIMLISSSRTTYTVVNTEAVLQEEAETVRIFINEIALEAKDCTADSASEDVFDSSHPNDRYMWILAPDNSSISGGSTDLYYYCLLFDKDSETLRYGKYPFDTTDILDTSSTTFYKTLLAGLRSDKYSLLAQHVTGFECFKDGNIISVTLSLNYNNTDATKTMIFSGRNM